MDGFKRKLENSIQFKLSIWLSSATLIVAILAGIFAFYSAFDEAHELQDDVLRQVATLFEQHSLSIPQNGYAGGSADSGIESRIFVQLISPIVSTSTRNTMTPMPPLPQNLPEGMQTVVAGTETYRVLVRTLKTGQRLAIAQETDIRDEIARESSFRTLIPFFILALFLLLVLTNLIRRIFKPITDLSMELDRRSEEDLHAIDTVTLPSEIKPFIGAINRLLSRVGHSMDLQRRFVSDAAHELRSPLTALSLQAERLAYAELSAEAHTRLATLRRGIDRAKSLQEQLLSLAKMQATSSDAATPISLQMIFRRVLEDLMPLAELKHIDIGVTSTSDARINCNELDMLTLVKNLVDNAIRYTQARGRIDLTVGIKTDVIDIIVEDNGPGIPEQEWSRVFDRFYRVLGQDQLGSGLGLSIVRSIADRLDANVNLSFSDLKTRTGLRVTVSFPAGAAALHINAESRHVAH